ncbi:alpha/beta fold hydrolase [Sphingomonas sp. 22176]|uniref:alpha/beta fold hydrolase n=1 Tax=Sphingomonas sp. 22176 TaxID=3453884 RepID=UPI003F87D14E
MSNAFFDGSRRSFLAAGTSGAAAIGFAASSQAATPVAADPRFPGSTRVINRTASTLRLSDGTELYYKDWGKGPAVVFCHGYPLSSDAWEDQMFFLAARGFRVVAYDRRGFGRSSQPSHGYDYDTFADDLATLIEALDLRAVTLIGHSMGGGEVARYIGRHGEGRIARAAFVAAVTPFLLKTADNPNGAPKALFDTFRAAVLENRAQWNRDVTIPYYSFNRPGAKPSDGLRENYWRQGQATGIQAAYHALGAFSETDFRADLAKITVPTLVVHGDDDQIVPIEISGKLTAQLVPHAQLLVYKGGSHGLLHIDKERLNADLLAFLQR